MDYYRTSMGLGRAAAAYRRLEELRPDLSQTSGVRSAARNALVGGSEGSKHLRPPGLGRRAVARDYVADGMPWDSESDTGLAKIEELEHVAKVLGLWATVHGDGPNQHLHTQPVAPGTWDYPTDGWPE